MHCGRGTAARCAIRRAKLTPRLHQALHAEALYAKGSIGDRICQPIPTHPIMQREAYSIASRERAWPATRSSLRRCGARPAHVCPSSPSNEFMRGVAICTLILHALQVGHANKLGRKPIAPEIVHRQQRDLRASCRRPTLWLRADTVFIETVDEGRDCCERLSVHLENGRIAALLFDIGVVMELTVSVSGGRPRDENAVAK